MQRDSRLQGDRAPQKTGSLKNVDRKPVVTQIGEGSRAADRGLTAPKKICV